MAFATENLAPLEPTPPLDHGTFFGSVRLRGDMFDGSGEKSPHEPEEFDPDSLGPDIPEAPDPTGQPGDVDSEVQGLFWGLVFVANVALIAASLGVMFAVFRDQWFLGSQLVLAGTILGGYVYYRVRSFQSD